MSGECYSSKLIQISISDTSVEQIESAFKEYKSTDKLKNAFTEFNQFQVIELNKMKDSLFNLSGINFSIKETYSDTSKFTDYLKEKVEKYYRAIPHNPDSYVIPPQFSGVKAQLKYYYKSGLYINYKIDGAMFVPYRKLLIVFTKQSMIASGGDSIHGFMIFQLAN